jgi:hypothetical protein
MIKIRYGYWISGWFGSGKITLFEKFLDIIGKSSFDDCSAADVFLRRV